MTDLLVASAGGHFQQLWTLSQSFVPEVRAPLWVTYDSPQTNSVLEGSARLVAHYPTTRNIKNAALNYGMARHLLRESAIRRVISTGAGIAVPFLAEAARRRIPAFYVESATRANGLSVSGRLLLRVPGVTVFTQYAEMARDKVHYAGSIFDNYVPVQATRAKLTRVLVTTGTHEMWSFDRLVQKLTPILRDVPEVIWQLTDKALRPPYGEVRAVIPANEFQSLLREVDLVIGHAGTGTAIACFNEGRRPLLVPRRAAFQETVDDHQVSIGRELARRGLATVAEIDDLSLQMVADAACRGGVASAATKPFLLTSQR